MNISSFNEFIYHLSSDVYSLEQRRGISTAIPYKRGQMVAVRYQSHWYRARVLEFKAATNFAWVLILAHH
jgi:uncharacterized protein YcfL